MEKNNDLNKFNLEFDFLCLKDHLNASFDKDNISVSDDLINKTIQAAKVNTSSEVNSFETIKKRKLPARGIVQVAAAILLVFVFLNLAGNLRIGSQKSSESASEDSNSVTYDTAAKTDDIPYTSRKNNLIEESTALFSEEISQEPTTAMEEAKEFAVDHVTKQEIGTEEPNNGLEGTLQSYNFIELYPISAEQILSFTVTSKSQESIMGDTKRVDELFSILNAYSFIPGDKNISSEWKYKIEFQDDATQIVTIWIGDGIQIKKYGDVTETETYYSVDNIDDLLLRVEEFYKNLSEN